MGFGTEKIEEQIEELLPAARVDRLDRDKVTSPGALQRIVSRFERGESNILVGTQMVTKGFDFERVTLVGILNADNMLNSPDFRAEERAFQLMMQVAGRAGRRKGAQGEVVIQSSQPTHRTLRYVAEGDYEGFARELLAERQAFSYPPYARITEITMRHKSLNKLNGAANTLAATLRERFGRRLQGPVAPAVDRIRDEHIVVLTIKVEAGASNIRARAHIVQAIEQVQQISEYKSVTILCNVDPQ